MLLETILAVFLAVGIAHCQTPPGFEPSTSHKLGVKFSKKVAVHLGNKLDKDDTQTIPHLKVKSLTDDAKNAYCLQTTIFSSHYMVFMIDLDVPQNDTTVPFLHWYQPDLNLDPKSGRLFLPKSSHLSNAEYYPPSPPPGPPHRYVELLFGQPPHYKLPSQFEKYLDKKSSARAGFDMKEFIKAANLKRPIAGNWFLVQKVEDENEEL
ncbi:conserved hypothetical protein [Talaromyces stipitatus ATCC 10500]|uniref:Phosphatidylethanolamine-binding protein n=1 Tax=Talaromyces stipitatus (strain ATCC 10500 / CBS 375.48 / QM 6759 / NRRL 1006) TaxID=441959 RepID=B8MMQ2_TALSN|nr:uncharacterized protein TSTA_098760 [Talaromyces stipitatus ATCC 10500]EED13619.1 conserved hypothetical protein [Talaromyces stipitatus ATCC 10500]